MNLEESGIERIGCPIDLGYGKTRECRFYRYEDQLGASVSLATSLVVPLSLQDWYKNNSANKIEKRKQETAGMGSQLHAIPEAEHKSQEVVVPDGGEAWMQNWEQAKKEFDITAEHSEVMVFSKRYSFGGQIDRIGNFAGKKCVIDFKSGSYSVMDLWKTEAYRRAYVEMTGETEIGAVVLYLPRPELLARGQKPRHYTIQQYDSCFLSFLSAYQVFKMTYYSELLKAGMTRENVFQKSAFMFYENQKG